MELNFKSWLEDIDPATQQQDPKKLATDPTVGPAMKKAQMAMKDAIKKGKNPIAAAQDAVAQSDVPMNRLGDVMPKDMTINKRM